MSLRERKIKFYGQSLRPAWRSRPGHKMPNGYALFRTREELRSARQWQNLFNGRRWNLVLVASNAPR